MLPTEDVVPSVASHAHPSDVISMVAALSNICRDLLLNVINKTILTPWLKIYLLSSKCSVVLR